MTSFLSSGNVFVVDIIFDNLRERERERERESNERMNENEWT